MLESSLLYMCGKKIIISDLAETLIPAKKSRNKRLQKKFIKKYGFKIIPGCLETNDVIFIHPKIFYKFKQNYDNNNRH